MSETEDPMVAVLATENTRRPQVTVALLPRLTEMARRLSAVRSAIKRGTHTKDSSYSRWSLVYEIRPAHTADDDGEDSDVPWSVLERVAMSADDMVAHLKREETLLIEKLRSLGVAT